MLRVVENNDWVIIGVFLCIVALLLVSSYLNKGLPLTRFLNQGLQDTVNVWITWVLVSLVFCVLFSILVCDYLPTSPLLLENFTGYYWSKFGYSFLVITSFYMIKMGFTYFFYYCINQVKRLRKLYFQALKLYLKASIFIIILIFVNYFLEIDKYYYFYFLIFVSFLFFLIKNMTYLMDKNQALPEFWYYKLLYICTLQIAPLFVLWRLFF